MSTNSGHAMDLALQALRAMHAGRLAEGTSFYRRALEAPDGKALPVARHVRMLEGSGRAEAARAVLCEGLWAGCDLSSGKLHSGGDPAAAAAEFESLFARGIANPPMMSSYMVALSRIGDAARLAAVAAPSVLFRRATLPSELNERGFLERVAKALLSSETREFQRARKSLREMDRVSRTHQSRDPDIRALHRGVRQLMDDYIVAVSRTAHLISPWIDYPYHLHSWGVITEGGGHSAPHEHSGCWIVAVAYIAGQEATDGNGGAMQVGPHPYGDAACEGWPRETVAPTPGSVVIMPAFYTHWTVPLDRPGLRISVAFNAAEVDHGWHPCGPHST